MPPTEEDLAWFRSTFRPIPKPALPDDCVEYSLYIISADLDANNDSESRLHLREVQKAASELQKKWLKDYIWQRQGFGLELSKEDGVSLLRGRTEYGDSVEDEWVVVWLLRELTTKFPDLWIKVTDNDGEFLIIEASGTLPAWLEPEVADNRVWLHNGGIVIIKPATASRSSKHTDEKLSLRDAHHIILKEPKRFVHSTSIEAEAFFRLRNYPAQIADNMHHAVINVSRKVAYLLRQKPAYISPAIEAFYVRDPIALKPLRSKDSIDRLIFSPKDLVTISVRFPRVGYAQVRSQEFPPPAAWAGDLPPKTEHKLYARAETGMKISCGFEMLLTDPQNQDKPAVREMKMLLEDLDSGDEKLPTNEEIEGWDKREDDEHWLDISFEDLESELSGNRRDLGGGKKSGFGDKSAEENLQRIVKQFEQFLNDDKAGPDGAGLFAEDSDDDMDDDDDETESDDGEDKEASFDEDEFTKMMREMMGMPPEVMREVMVGKMGGASASKTKGAASAGAASVALAAARSKNRIEEIHSSDSEDGEGDIQALMDHMEAELRESGALDLDPSVRKTGATKRAIEAAEPNLVVGSHGRREKRNDSTGDGDDDDDDDEGSDGVNVDVNLAKNLLESLKAQAGRAGPGGNLMGLMGLAMPRDESGNSHPSRGDGSRQ